MKKNIIELTRLIFNKSYRLAQTVWFLVFKKPIYTLLYNSNGNRFECHGILRNSSIKVSGGGCIVIIGHGTVLNNMKIEINGTGNSLVIHNNVHFLESGRVLMEDEGNLIEIGDDSSFQSCFFAVRGYGGKARIGKNCLFSANVIIRTSDAHSILNEKNEHINPERDTIIEDHVWVGYGANILKGSHIETNCVVGTQAVVSGHTIPAGSVIAGNPAKIVKENIHWTEDRLR